jgi:HAD superfamily hydrolase (TIGR01509 family)
MNQPLQPLNSAQIRPDFSWSEIDTVLLDMDGTLLDKYFDDYFWEEYVPQMYGQKNGLSLEQATEKLMNGYRSVEDTLSWTDLDFWSDRLDLDIPALKVQINHLIQIHPFVIEFLSYISDQVEQVCLVTAAHNKTLAIKMEKADLTDYFHRIICAEEIGVPKELPEFWLKLEELLGFEKSRAFFADDTNKVLHAARQHGIAQVIHVARPSSRNPVRYSDEFPSIAYFNELIF